MRSLLVLGSASADVFDDDEAWLTLNELLDVLLFDAVQSSSLGRFVAFAELLQVTLCEADVVTFLSQWLPALLVGVVRPSCDSCPWLSHVALSRSYGKQIAVYPPLLGESEPTVVSERKSGTLCYNACLVNLHIALNTSARASGLCMTTARADCSRGSLHCGR